ncbi:MAG TPA: DNA repair protein RecN [Candidatus Dormibacteraeota bacterium]|nr:DNA repair protein RecN [Candidatus Dormibacteraeota bacterium]
MAVTMLRELSIRNLAVVEEAVVPFAPGLNVLTGETGAGKSIVVDALLLITGARAQLDWIRTGADTALVEAVFEIDPAGPVAALLDEAGHHPGDGQLVIKRELARSGRHRAFVNDGAATVGLLERLGELLVELHGQHEHQRLMEPARQLLLLDRFAEALDRRERVGALVRTWEEARAALDRLRSEMREGARQEDLYRFQLAEIDDVRLKDGEEEELRAERSRLQHAERIAAGLQETVDLLYEEPQSATTRLSRAATLLRDLSRYEPDAAASIEAIEGAQAYLEDVVGRARALRDRAVFDPERLEQIDARLDAIVKLKRKYGDSVAAILAHRQEVATALDRITRHDAIAEEMERGVAAAAAAAGAEAAALSQARTRGAERLERLIQKEIRGLGMEHGRFRVALRREPAAVGELAAGPDGWRVGPRGAESAELLLSANPGEDLRPLAKVVSGGELSRVMLAAKTVLAAADDVPVLVFDEVDAGIGGRVADVVGQKLAASAAGRQVLCVTHLAPIAAYAGQHLLVEKRVARGATRTTVTLLPAAARVDELARMLGGERVTEASRRHARELLRGAR